MAGSTASGRLSILSRRDHPRVGGEHVEALTTVYVSTGSPPRWRGAQTNLETLMSNTGITPALAGSTTLRISRSCAGRDHPRVGGEHTPYSALPTIRMGSPPRWRGARRSAHNGVRIDGITPALAGSTRLCPRRVVAVRDHPRVGGEHARRRDRQRPATGSPPRWRGAPVISDEQLLAAGITPALAGSTGLDHCSSGSEGDHPRVGGEHSPNA